MNDFYMSGGNVLDVRNGDYIRKDLRITDGRISEITDRPEKGIPVVDCTGKYLTPGIIDAHVHLVWDGTSPDPMTDTERDGDYLCFAKGVMGAYNSLKAGVTTVRDVGCNDDCAIPLAAAIRRGYVKGCNIIPAGSAIQGSYGHCPMIGYVANTEAELIDKIKRLKAYHIKMQTPPVHWVKIMTSGGAAGMEDVGPCMYSDRELKTIAEEAHRLNMKVASHALSYDAISRCLKAGIDTIAHGADLDEELLTYMKEHDQCWVPTVGVYKSLSESRGIIADSLVDKATVVKEKQKKAFAAAREIGTKIILGSDAGSANCGAHPFAFVEMYTMHDFGMPADEVLRCATVNSAEYLGIGNDRGSLEIGKYADIVVLNADPLADMHAFTEALDSVFKEGQLVE